MPGLVQTGNEIVYKIVFNPGDVTPASLNQTFAIRNPAQPTEGGTWDLMVLSDWYIVSRYAGGGETIDVGSRVNGVFASHGQIAFGGSSGDVTRVGNMGGDANRYLFSQTAARISGNPLDAASIQLQFAAGGGDVTNIEGLVYIKFLPFWPTNPPSLGVPLLVV